jgi:hypothetical protein
MEANVMARVDLNVQAPDFKLDGFNGKSISISGVKKQNNVMAILKLSQANRCESSILKANYNSVNTYLPRSKRRCLSSLQNSTENLKKHYSVIYIRVR